MTGRYSDYEALRPNGEATHVPDDQLTGGGEPRRQRSGSIDAGYPDDPTAVATECESCGASIPAGQAKCRFCLTNHLGNEAIGMDETADPTLFGIIHLVVESTTFYGAVAKGGAAANLLTSNDAEPAVDDYTLLYDLDEPPAPQLADRWPPLPAAVQLDSGEGEQLLRAARDRTGWHGQEASERQEQAPTRLYDQRGDGIRDTSRLTEVLDDTDDAVWLVPAIALQQSGAENSTGHSRHERPNRTHLECQECGRETEHRFREFETVPDDEWTGQPMWGCQRCGTPRYGPEPEAGQ
ncbi:hypothetical protein [Haloplanus halobius]|uniref:biosurfactant protein 1 n=1 Tax=Haloplanus halobius TaxID=2934938 RepID=UPI00200F264C|nr:hypothetical protein [Haloplanus sp. XH21]